MPTQKMNEAQASSKRRRLVFSWQELSGSFGDLGTFLPLAVLLAINCEMDLGIIFVLAGLMNILTGLVFNQPIAVQPMKAIAAVAIAEGLTRGEVAAAGIIMGVLMLAVSFSGAAAWIGRSIPKAIVRGIQLGVGLKLVMKALDWIFGVRLSLDGIDIADGLPLLGYDSILVAFMVLGLLLIPGSRRSGGLVIVFLAGFGLLFLIDHGVYEALTVSWPQFGITSPTGPEWVQGFTRGAVPQAPLTMLNSVIAVCALSGDYFPGQGVSPRRMAMSVGLLNLLIAPFGGMPMCHGAGGLAAQYRFGARTGGSIVMLGFIKISAGLVLGVALLNILDQYPRSILAVMLLFAGIGLAIVARDTMKGTGLVVVLSTALPIIMFNTAIGFAVGVVAALVFFLIRRCTARAEQ